MASAEQEAKKTRDARNEEIFASRFTRLNHTIAPWLKKVAGEKGTQVVIDLDLSTATKEAKEECLLRNIENIFAVALPLPFENTSPNRDDATAKDISADRAAGDPLYSELQFDKRKGNEQIRLLKLLPSKESSSEVLATLFCVSSPQEHKYDALSYTWGPPNPRHIITLNRQPFEVGTNLHNALVSLRFEDRPRLLWVDAICINQQDDAEKAVQVAYMGTIYREAENIAVFLGMPTIKSYPLFDFIGRDRRVDDVTQENVEEIIAECGMDKASIVTSFVEFCDREWWTRVWVMQEYYLATRPPLWYVGSRSVNGRTLHRDVQGLAMMALRVASPFGYTQDLSEELGNHTMNSLADRMIKTADGVLMRRETTAYNTPRLLFARHGRKATNAADYVYGVRELLEPHFRQVFVPDYGLDRCKLFEKLATWLLLMDGWGDMLWYYPFRKSCECVAPGAKCELPSWVPDFSKRPDHLISEPEPPKFSKDDPKTVNCAIVDKVLYIDGCHLDLVQEVIPMPTGRSFEVSQRIWQLDRVFCSNQRSDSTVDTNTKRESRALLGWATTLEPATLPLYPRAREVPELLGTDLRQYLGRIGIEAKALLDERYAESKVPPETAEKQEEYKRVASDIAATHGRQIRGIGNLHNFLCMEMECDFAGACIFDISNLDSQLRTVGESPSVQEGLGSILSRAGPRDVVYEDLIRHIESNSIVEDPTSFRDLVAVVRSEAKRIHSKIVGETPDTRPRSPVDVAEIRELLEGHREQIKKLEEKDQISCHSFRTDEEREERIRFLRGQVEDMESRLELVVGNEERYNQIGGAEETSWSRWDDLKAAPFRGRKFFVTRGGLFGVASPGVADVRVGDRVVLLDGLSFPLIARDCEGERLSVVGCANIRDVKLHHKVEDAEFKEGVQVRPGPKQVMAFV